jgi:hypothetical protein
LKEKNRKKKCLEQLRTKSLSWKSLRDLLLIKKRKWKVRERDLLKSGKGNVKNMIERNLNGMICTKHYKEKYKT